MLPTAKAADYITNLNVFNWVFLVGADKCCLYAVVSASQNGNVGKIKDYFLGLPPTSF